MSAGFQGFDCPRGIGNVDILYCLGTCGERCLSIPMLVALYGEKREVVPKRYHVTEILNPPQIVYLARTREYYCSPMSMVWMLFGSAIHTIMECGHDGAVKLGLEDRFIKEHRFEANIGDCVLSGRYDLYDKVEKTLWDYKSIKQYAVEKAMSGDFADSDYADQFNIYRVFGCPEAKHIKMEAIVKDWSQMSKVNPVEDIEFPIYQEEYVRDKVRMLIETHEEAQRTGEPRPCEASELWFPQSPRSKNFGIPIRCRDYCKVSTVCPQYKEWKDLNAG